MIEGSLTHLLNVAGTAFFFTWLGFILLYIFIAIFDFERRVEWADDATLLGKVSVSIRHVKNVTSASTLAYLSIMTAAFCWWITVVLYIMAVGIVSLL